MYKEKAQELLKGRTKENDTNYRNIIRVIYEPLRPVELFDKVGIEMMAKKDNTPSM